MKKIIILLAVLSATFTISCSDIRFGDDAFSLPPEGSGATLDSMFSSMLNADRVLSTSYLNLPYGIPTELNSKLGWNVLESITDLQHSWRNNIGDGPRNIYYNGGLSSNIPETLLGSEAHRFGVEDQYTAIRYAWIYIENADRIPDITDAKRKERVAEAKVNIAISYFELLRYVGGVPIIDHSIDVNEEMKFPRNTFEETVNFIIRMLDEAKNDLPWVQDEININGGRMTKAAALALKLRVLCFAASDTFNSDTKWHAQADQYTCYGNQSDVRWEAAFNAGEEFMLALKANGHYRLVVANGDTHMERRLAFRQAYFETGTNEMIISIRKGFDRDLNGIDLSSAPTLNYADMFPWEDGSDFPEDFDWENPSKQPFFTPDGSSPGIPTRDPRLYETIAVPGDIFLNGSVSAVHINHPRTDGHTEATGFEIMKFNLQRESDRNEPPHWPYLRYAEVLLNYAEAINEHRKNPIDAYEYVNEVRNRVGLPELPKGLDRFAFRKELIKERALEFGLEEVRWFDLIRWGLKEEFTKTLFKLQSIGLDDDTSPTTFKFSKQEIGYQRTWAKSWDSKWYLSPIPQNEVNKNYGMTQNPGW